MADLECEIKLTLPSETDYRAVLERLPNGVGEVAQHNLFFDTPGRLLSARGWSLRLRREETEDGTTAHLLTVKGASTRVAGALRRTELEAPFAAAVWHRALTGELTVEDLAGPPVVFLTDETGLAGPLVQRVSFANLRTLFEVTLGQRERLLQLDRTVFEWGEPAYEIEIELDPSQSPAQLLLDITAVSADLRRLLAALGVQATPSKSGKFSRALERKKQLL